MKNTNLDNTRIDDEINFTKLYNIMINSKKLIIIITSFFLLISSIYSLSREPQYLSKVILEIGSYDSINGEKKLIESVENLIKQLKIELIYKQELDINKFSFISIEDELLEIDYKSSLPKFNESLLEEAIIFTEKRHEKIIHAWNYRIEFQVH